MSVTGGEVITMPDNFSDDEEELEAGDGDPVASKNSGMRPSTVPATPSGDPVADKSAQGNRARKPFQRAMTHNQQTVVTGFGMCLARATFHDSEGVREVKVCCCLRIFLVSLSDCRARTFGSLLAATPSAQCFRRLSCTITLAMSLHTW